MSRHKWADLIHAWAEGAEIQKFCGDGWYNDSDTPEWFEDCEYRIKPRTVKHVGWVNICKNKKTYANSPVHCCYEEAVASRPICCVATVKVEWEETI